MADPIVGATVQVLLEKALSLATDKIDLVFGFKQEVMNLRKSIVIIQAVLADAENKQSHDPSVQLWLKELQRVAFDSDHLLDELYYETIRRKVVESRNQQLKLNKVCFFFSFSSTNIAFRWRMASKVRDINIKLKKINQEAHDFGLNIRHQIEAALRPIAGVTTSRLTDSIVPPIVVGRTNDESRIVEMLLSSSEELVSVIPIVGMGGLGKTTLAKSIYNNPQIKGHFESRSWVCPSENFEGMELFKLILESLTGRKVELSSRDAIVQEIQKVLQGKRYLLVLDDVWNKNQKLWDDFFDSLVGLITMKGSRCLVTTRLEQVASIVTRHSPYKLEKLSDDDCWSILKGKGIAVGEVSEELNIMREQILKRCDGLPLAASVLGGLLRIKGKEEWLTIVGKKLLNSSEDENSIEQILKLSFNNLPSSSIKKCFAYCSIFAKDTVMQKDVLIELWMAEGFLQSDLNNQSTMEDTGDQYIRILLQSSLLEEAREDWGLWHYKMHDLVHDLAESISKHETIKLENGEINNCNQVPYFALHSCNEMTRKISKDISTSVRTLFLNWGLSNDELLKFKNLHVLKLSKGADLKELPTSIGELIHLRFLDLSNSEITTLPESVSKLYYLQTLRIRFIKKFPEGMRDLIGLRHLHCKFNKNIQMPFEIGQWTYLQTLEFFNVGEEKGRRLEELQCLKHLKGTLVIRNLELVNGKKGAEGANLSGKPNLLKLEFQWGPSSKRDGANCDEEILEGLQPHSNLQKLEIRNFKGNRFPQWLMNLQIGLDKLVELTLTDCKRCREIRAALGQLPLLQNLKIRGLEAIRSIGLSLYGVDDDVRERSGSTCSYGGQERKVMPSRILFPALKELTLANMKNLEEWTEPEVVAYMFPMLKKLTIDGCPLLREVPNHFPGLKELYFTGNDHVLAVKKILSQATYLSSLSIIGNMSGLTCVSDVISNSHQNLKFLRLRKCHDLTDLRGCGTSLELMQFRDCDNLRELPERLPKSLKVLEIINCKGLISLPGEMLESCSSLVSLDIYYCDNLRELPERLPKSLKCLFISDCKGLISLPGEMLESCSSLVHLHISECPNLVSFSLDLRQTPSLSEYTLRKCPKLMTNMMPKGFGFRTMLSDVSIGPFSDDNSVNEFDWSLQSTQTLYRLELYGLPDLESLPDQLQYLTNLKVLHLHDFGIEVLPDWLGNLAALEELWLRNCKKLQYLPSMAAMRCLTKLKYLQVQDCPLLKEKCSSQRGPDSERSKISHIPNRRIR